MKIQIGRILMRCLECDKNEFEYIEKMGETACKACGLIVFTELFEERVVTVENGELTRTKDGIGLGSNISGYSRLAKTHQRFSAKDTHIKKGIVFSQMVLSSIDVSLSPLRDRVGEVYRELYTKSIFSNANTLEVRGTAVAWFVMKENKTPVTIKEASKEFNCGGKSLNRLIRKINQYFGSRIRHLQVDPQFMLKKTASKITNDIVFISRCIDTLELFEPIVEKYEYNKRSAYYESICWITKNIHLQPKITLRLIADNTNASWSAIQKQTKEILGLIGLKTCAQVKGKQLSELGENKYE